MTVFRMNKYKGTGLEFDITPNNRIVYLKAARVIPGHMTNTVILEYASPEEMRPLRKIFRMMTEGTD